jgi:hypothetical protein
MDNVGFLTIYSIVPERVEPIRSKTGSIVPFGAAPHGGYEGFWSF